MEPQTNHAQDARGGFDKMLLPITFTVLGIGAITIAAILVYRASEKRRIAGDTSYDIENYDIVDKPFIYGRSE